MLSSMRFPIVLLVVLAACGDDTAPDASLDSGREDASSYAPDVALDGGAPLQVASVVDLGELPHPSDTVAGRDGTNSASKDGQLLWTFGDTFLYETTPVDGSNVASATGAWASLEAPFVLEQPVDADGIPAQLIPYTEDELAQNRSAPLDGWALWPGAVIDTGDADLLVLFQRIKRTAGSGFDGLGVGTARIAPRETVARRDPEDLFSRPMPPEEGPPLYGAGGVAVDGDMVYFFACEEVGFFNQGCRVARAPRARADERDAFEFFDGSSWVVEIDAAAVVIENASAGVSVSFNAHLGRYLCVTSKLLSDDVILRTAERIEGPWPDTGVVIPAGEGGILPAGEGTNYLALEQPALSDPDGTSVVISYSRPLGSFRGEVRLARITLE